jgi:ankyrin repeat protein
MKSSITDGVLRFHAWGTILLLCACADRPPVETPVDAASAALSACVPETNLGTPLMEAAYRGDAAAVRGLLEERVDVNEGNRFGMTALMYAAGQPFYWPWRERFPGSAEIARLLIARGADVNARAANGRTALMAAVESGDAESVSVLLGAGADVNAAASRGETALVLAAANGLDDVVQELLRRGAQVNLGSDGNGDTALMIAIRRAPGAREVRDEFCLRGVVCKVEFLARIAWDGVRQAAGLRAVTRSGIFERYFRTVSALLEHGADLTARNRNGNVPLTLAASGGHGRFVRLVLEHGADVNATDRAMGNGTALIIAVRNQNAAMIAAVLEKRPDLDREDRFGKSALDYAIEEDTQWAAGMLQQAGARTR